MESFTVALAQHPSPLGRKEHNLETTERLAREARARGAALVALPELSLTGHGGHPTMVAQAEPVPGGPSVRRLAELARDLGIYISAGIAEDDRGIHYNTQFLVGPEGYIGKQRKIHLSGDEYFLFRGGTRMPVLDTPLGRIGTVICYDNEFPEPARILAISGAEVLLAPHAARSGDWPDEAARLRALASRKRAWRLTLACRAHENGVYVLACNTAGASASDLEGVVANHPGGCMAFDPYGEVIAESQAEDVAEELVLVALDAEPLRRRRAGRCFYLQTRRPEVYGALATPTD